SLLETSPTDGTPTFSTVQQFAQALAPVLGLDTDAVKFDPVGNELTFHVVLNDSFAPAPLPLQFTQSLGPVGGISTSSTLSVSATALLDFTFGFKLALPAADQTLADLFFLRNPTVTGTVTLNAADIEALARFAFVKIGIANGTGAVSASLALSLT